MKLLKSMDPSGWKIWIDTGGTFTDCIAISPSGQSKRLKVLSSGLLRMPVMRITGNRITVRLPLLLPDDLLRGFRIQSGHHITAFDSLRGEITVSKPFPADFHPETIEVSSGEEVPVFATRLLTGTRLDQRFPPLELKLGSTRGTNALLERKGAKTAFLVTRGFKDLLLIGTQQRDHLFALDIAPKVPLYSVVLEIDERIESDGSVLHPIQNTDIDRIADTLRRKKITSVAVALLNSYRNPSHELYLGQELARRGFSHVSLAHQLSPQIKILPRAETAVVNAYLEPILHQYVRGIQQGLGGSNIQIMSSAGGLLPASDFRPKDSLLSGPAGGVIGALAKAKESGHDDIITFDMGGTSTDVSRCKKEPEYKFDCTVGNLKIFSPSLAIETIAAGGGSICGHDDFRLFVGPHSAGASPGPACYGAGGPLTLTDVNLLLGRLTSRNFSIPINRQPASLALQHLLRNINHRKAGPVTTEGALESFLLIANEKMAEAIRKISIRQGHDPKDYALLCFGGAGGQHACAVADLLQMRHIIIPYDAGLLSAYGIGTAQPTRIKEMQILRPLSQVRANLDQHYDLLIGNAKTEMKWPGDTRDIQVVSRMLFLRLEGQETSVEIEYTHPEAIEDQFISRYQKVFGHWLPREIEVESIRVIVSGTPAETSKSPRTDATYRPVPEYYDRAYATGTWRKCPCYRWETLRIGAQFDGPALLLSDNSTVWMEPGWRCRLDANLNANIQQISTPPTPQGTFDRAQLELFTNRFTAIAEDMGVLLQRTAFSVNVKERLDFSCAVLDARGNLVVNAPHIPVHLGSMGVCVRAVMKKLVMREGDVVITNHPAFGGSHLPDVTLIKPVFYQKTLIGFVANRAHHAEIGGMQPGSMPADACALDEEGVVISPTHLVIGGRPQWENIERLLVSSRYPTRALQENLADMNGALASVTLGAESLAQLCEKFGAATIHRYMQLLRKHAASLMRRRIRNLPLLRKATEYLDDGAKLKVVVTKNRNQLHIDFSGSAPVHKGNLNATQAIVHSVVLYVLRLLVGEQVPLNEGLLQPVRLTIPRGILNPAFSSDDHLSPAVVGGNTEISQRLTDTLLKAFKLAACSQGTMNNLLFGNESFGYYETICGGVGAGPGFNGADAVHQHMTNTRITDPEIIEFRYPVRLEKFEIRKGSGGRGQWNGGDGVVRQFFCKGPLDVNFLSQHRITAPYGILGGGPGKPGQQFYWTPGKRKKRLGGIAGIRVSPGDRFSIETPGGGGWGRPKK